MTRTSFKNLSLLVIALLLMASFIVFRKGQEFQTQIEKSNKKKERLTRDLRTSNQLSVALSTLDKLTIDEQQATRLDILRHLSLEKSELDFGVSSKAERKIGATRLFARTFTLKGELPYNRVLEQIDWLHGTKKVAINEIVLEPGKSYGDAVKFRVGGVLYGLDKSGKSAKRKKRRKKKKK